MRGRPQAISVSRMLELLWLGAVGLLLALVWSVVWLRWFAADPGELHHRFHLSRHGVDPDREFAEGSGHSHTHGGCNAHTHAGSSAREHMD